MGHPRVGDETWEVNYPTLRNGGEGWGTRRSWMRSPKVVDEA